MTGVYRWDAMVADTLCEFFNNAHFFSRATLTLVYSLGAQYKGGSILISWKYDEALWEKINCIATSYIFRELLPGKFMKCLSCPPKRFACQSDLQHGTKGSILITWKKMKRDRINRIVISFYIFSRDFFFSLVSIPRCYWKITLFIQINVDRVINKSIIVSKNWKLAVLK